MSVQSRSLHKPDTWLWIRNLVMHPSAIAAKSGVRMTSVGCLYDTRHRKAYFIFFTESAMNCKIGWPKSRLWLAKKKQKEKREEGHCHQFKLWRYIESDNLMVETIGETFGVTKKWTNWRKIGGILMISAPQWQIPFGLRTQKKFLVVFGGGRNWMKFT